MSIIIEQLEWHPFPECKPAEDQDGISIVKSTGRMWGDVLFCDGCFWIGDTEILDVTHWAVPRGPKAEK